MTSLKIPLLVVITTASVGCFDVSSGKPAPLLIDDFDSGDALPTDRHFDQWRCGKYNPDTTNGCECNYDPMAYHSPPYSIHLTAAIVETEKGRNAGVQLYTQAVASEDLSHLSQIAFSVMLELPTRPISLDPAVLYLELHCSLAPALGTAPAEERYVHHPVEYTNAPGWQSFIVALTQKNFSPPNTWKWSEIEGGLPTCLERVDGIHFSVNPQLAVGAAGNVDLRLDDIYFQ